MITHCEGSFASAVPPDVVDIDPNDFDVPKAVKRYGYKFDLDTSAPKRRALLVSRSQWYIINPESGLGWNQG